MDEGKDAPESEMQESGESAEIQEGADTQEEISNESADTQEQTKAPFLEDAPFCEVKELLERGDLKGAQEKLDWFFERGARWHYWQSVIYRRQNWLTDCRKSLERAASLDPENEEYKKELEELENMAESGKKFRKKRRETRTMGEKSWYDACIEGGGECCALVACELCCQAACEGLGSC